MRGIWQSWNRRRRIGLVLAIVTLAGAAALPALVGQSNAAEPAAAAAPPSTLFPATSTPAVPAFADTRAVELGLRFSSRVAGTVAGVRFFRGAGNTGPHVGSLWDAAGRRLATVRFTDGTSTGWQQANFAQPVAIQAGSVYTVSYFAPAGRYAVTSGFFRAAVTREPLRSRRGTEAGVYRYGATSGFPTSSYSANNYWVDVAFRAGATPPSPSTPPSATPTVAPTPTATPTRTVTPTVAPTRTATPTPTPTRTGTPPPTGACRTAEVWRNLEACGFPGPGNTGFPAGQQFSRTVTNGLVITADNTVIDGAKVSGGIQVRARNVIIRNSWVTSSFAGRNGSGTININPGASATIERNLIDGLNATHSCVWHEGSSATIRANNCQGVNDGIFMWATQEGVDGTGDNFTIVDNYLHGFTTKAANGHIDGIQTEGAKHGVIRHNTIDVADGQNAAVALWNGRKSTDDIVVEGNLLAGGGFTVYAEDYSPSEASPAGGFTLTNVSFRNNVFSTVHFPCVGSFGVWFSRGAPSDMWRRTGNTVLETGQSVDGGNPTAGGRTCN